MKNKFWQKIFALLSVAVLVFNSVGPLFSVAYANDGDVTPTPEISQEVTPTPDNSTPTPTTTIDQPTDTVTPTPTVDQATPTDTIAPTPDEVTATPTPKDTTEVSVTPTPANDSSPPAIDNSPISPESSATLVTPSKWTFENVELNREYIAPQNSGVKLTFTKLPSPSGNVKIEEITLTEEQIEQTGSLSDKAYDITSDMEDGTFQYDLTLPLPDQAKGQNVEVKSSETVDGLINSQDTNQPQEITSSTVTVSDLNHFTVFVLVANPNSITDGMLSAIKDAWIDQTAANQDTNHGNATTLQIQSRDGGRNQRALLQFDLSSIATGSAINSAKVRLYMTNAPTTSRTYQIYKITPNNWVEGDGGANNDPSGEVRWDNQPSIGSVIASATVLSTAPDGWVEFDVTSDIAAFLTGTPNYGWTIEDSIESESSTARTVTFVSKEGTESRRPQLSIDFTIASPSNTGPSDTGGFNSPSSQTAVTSNSGDDNGYQGSPANALTANETFATDNSSGDNNNSDCSDSGTGVDRHIFSNYGISIPTGATIKGIEIRQDLKVNNLNDSPFTCVQLSSDGGDTWTAVKQSSLTTTDLIPYYFGNSTDLWGRSWDISDFTNFKVRVINGDTDNSNDSTNFSLDWVPVRVYYAPFVNSAPVAVDNGPYSIDEDTSLSLPANGILANDTDADSDPLTATLVSDVTHGTLVLNSDGSLDYTPDLNYNGTDTFIYVANDGTVDSNEATVSIIMDAVNDAPVIDSVTITPSDPRTNSNLSANVIAHDDDEDGLNYSYQWKKNGENVGGDASTLNLSTPGNGDKDDVITVTVTADDGNGGTDTETSSQVTILNSQPEVSVPGGSIPAVEDTPLPIDLSDYISDVDNDPLTFSILSDQGPYYGNVVLSDSTATYTPSSDFYSPPDDTFSFQANDGAVDSNVAQLFITVGAVNDTPIANDDSYSTNQDTALIVAVPGVLENDTDVDGPAMSAILVGDVSNGTLTLNADGSFTYNPTPNYHGSDSFTYNANDGELDSDTAEVSIAVVDNVSPQLTLAETRDIDGNGKLDAIKLTFNENINDSMLEAGADGWDVDGYSGEAIGTGSGIGSDNDNILLLSFNEGLNFDSGNTPTITYAQDVPPRSTHDLAGNELASDSWTTTDKASPILLSAETKDVNSNGQIDAIKLTFSEDIDDSLLDTLSNDGWDVDGYDGEIIGSGSDANDNILLLTFDESGTPDTENTPSVSYNTGTSTHDKANNELPITTKTSIDKAPPILSISPAAGDYNSDQLATLTTSESANIFYTTDDSTPDGTSTPYTVPIDVDKDMTIKAIAYDPAGNASSILSATYGIAPIISAEASSSVTDTSTTITWTTDDPATSRVIYDTISHPTLGAAPNYGYANSTTEDSTKVLAHSVIVSGLSASTTYYYRTVSHGSPEAVSNEQSFSTSATTSNNSGGGAGDGLSDGLGCGSHGCNNATTTSQGQVLGASIWPTVLALTTSGTGQEILGTTNIAEEQSANITPTPTISEEVLGNETTSNTPNLNLLKIILIIILILIILGFLGYWLSRKQKKT